MTLTDKEKLVAIISNGIAVYSLFQERGEVPKHTTMYDFILKVIPDNLKPNLSAEIIDEVFEFVSNTHNS
ncbi:MAG: hypothetical protein R3327_06010 [Nitrosopumilaceae archaeon]|nr:hypothetical protein [Nitrosopumilaceae archaeon]